MATKKQKSASGIQLPSNLSFMRSLELTSGMMLAVKDKNKGGVTLEAVFEGDTTHQTPVRVTATTIRGTISNDHKDAPAKRIDKGEKSLNAPNIATIEQALLPADAQHLLVKTCVRFAAHATRPDCNSPSFAAALKDLVDAYAQTGGFDELAKRFLLNIANGSWLWRNRFGQNVEVRMALGEEVAYFSEADIDMSEGFEFSAITDEAKRQTVAAWVKKISDAVSGGHPLTFEVAGLVELGYGAEVFPSQEFTSHDTEKVVKGRDADKVARVLSKQITMAGDWVATIHARKVANAIRTIDTWHGRADVGAIAVEPYGANTHQGVAYRIENNDLYTYLEHPDVLVEELKEGISGKHHFVMACLLRGGVFGFAKASKAGKADKGAEPDGADAHADADAATSAETTED